MSKEIEFVNKWIKRQSDFLKDTENSYLISELHKDIDMLNSVKHKLEENKELQEQLKNAIVPKFKIGQEVYYIESGKIYTFVITNIKNRYSQNKFLYYESELFATKEEAKQKLKELKGENYNG